MSISQVQGARLAYVVKKLDGTVKRTNFKFNRRTGKIEPYEVDEPAGFLVFFPQGHYLRIRTREDLVRYKINYKPPVISMSGVYDQNSPVGKLMSAQDEDQRIKAWEDMEADIAAIVRKRSGPMAIEGYSQPLPIPSHNTEVNYV